MVFMINRSLLGKILHKLALVLPGGDTLRPWLHRVRGVRIGKGVWISQFVYIDDLHPECVSIGDNSSVGIRTSIISHLYFGPRQARSNGNVTIGRDVFIGPHCVVLPNVTIGDGAVIKAGTVVSRNVPAHALMGSPSAEALGFVTVPLTREHSYEEFTRGIRMRAPVKQPGPNDPKCP